MKDERKRRSCVYHENEVVLNQGVDRAEEVLIESIPAARYCPEAEEAVMPTRDIQREEERHARRVTSHKRRATVRLNQLGGNWGKDPNVNLWPVRRADVRSPHRQRPKRIE